MALVRFFGAIFYQHGKLIAARPWEIIVASCTLLITLTITAYNVNHSFSAAAGFRQHEYVFGKGNGRGGSSPASGEFGSIVAFGALIYLSQQLKSLKNCRRLVAVSAVLYVLFSAVTFAATLICLFGRTLAHVKEALPLFLFVVDLSKAACFAQHALGTDIQVSCVSSVIGEALAAVAPGLTLDTLIVALVIGVGGSSTADGMMHLAPTPTAALSAAALTAAPISEPNGRFESLAIYAVLSAVVNYVVFLSFYPALLALIFEVSRKDISGADPAITEPQANPVLQRVKLLMSAGLMLVHAHHRCTPVVDDEISTPPPQEVTSSTVTVSNNHSDEVGDGEDRTASCRNLVLRLYERATEVDASGSQGFPSWLSWISFTVEQGVILSVALAIAVKYLFSERRRPSKQGFPAPALVGFVDATSLERPTQTLQTELAESAMFRSCIGNIGVAPYRYTVSRKGTPDDQSDKSANKIESRLKVAPAKNDIQTFACVNKEIQTDSTPKTFGGYLERGSIGDYVVDTREDQTCRSVLECVELLSREGGPSELTDKEVMMLLDQRLIPAYKLETVLDNPLRGVAIRRHVIARDADIGPVFRNLPYLHYDYSLVMGACCENVIGYVPVPVGVAGPLLVDGQKFYVPMATTEGCLIASTNRGCRAITKAGGACSEVIDEGMTRGPVVKLPSAVESARVMLWLQKKENFDQIKLAFDETSRFARLRRVQCRVAGKYLFIRFISSTGDAMGMNMLSKGSEVALLRLREVFPQVDIISVSGNYCTDKKPAAVNWIEGRGKGVVAEVVIPAKHMTEILKTSAKAVVEVNTSKNLIGSAVAGSIGGFNAQAANIVTAIYIATGQDPAQNVGSSNCITIAECCGENNDDLYISCTMPSIEVGTVGGGTILPAQGSLLELLGVKGSSPDAPGEHARRLARVVCATVLAGELSLLSALAAGQLVRSHMRHNRSAVNVNASATRVSDLQNSSSVHLVPEAFKKPSGSTCCYIEFFVIYSQHGSKLY